jgi:predicted transcriptional regulator
MRMPHGEGHPSARLTAADVITMRQRYADGGVTQRELSSEYGVTQAHVDKIIRRKKWPYLP